MGFVSQIDIMRIREDIRVHCWSFVLGWVTFRGNMVHNTLPDGNLTSCATTALVMHSSTA